MRKALVVALVVAGAAGVAAVANAQMQMPQHGEKQMGDMQGHRAMGMAMHGQMHGGRGMHGGDMHGAQGPAGEGHEMDHGEHAAPPATPTP